MRIPCLSEFQWSKEQLWHHFRYRMKMGMQEIQVQLNEIGQLEQQLLSLKTFLSKETQKLDIFESELRVEEEKRSHHSPAAFENVLTNYQMKKQDLINYLHSVLQTNGFFFLKFSC